MRYLVRVLLITLSLSAACGGVAQEQGKSTASAGSSGVSAAGSSGSQAAADAGGASAGDAGSAGSAGDGLANAGASPTRCRSESDCMQSENGPNGFEQWTCVGPDEPFRCGPVYPEEVPVTCGVDSECDPHKVCRADPTIPPGWLGSSGMACLAPCSTDAECPATAECESGGHCKARTCPECPSYFSCTGGTCVIPQCTTDAECHGGYCVKGSCAGKLGACQVLCF